jgi:hypothetical protein
MQFVLPLVQAGDAAQVDHFLSFSEPDGGLSANG